MKRMTIFVLCLLWSCMSFGETAVEEFTLDQAIRYGLEHSPVLKTKTSEVAAEQAGIRAAQAERLPRLDMSAGVTKYHYPTATEPLYGTPPNTHFPSAFYTTIYDAGLTFSLPLYRGGRLSRGVAVAELRRSIAEEMYSMTRQDLIYNITNAYYKVLQLEKIVKANDETVKQLEAHRRNVELLFQAGTAAKVDVLKAETELAHARQAALISRNSLESAYELLKMLMGMDDMDKRIRLAHDEAQDAQIAPLDQDIQAALSRRPDYQAAIKRTKALEESVALAKGRHYPSLNLIGEYSERSGPVMEWNENWFIGLRLFFPIFEGGSISADVGKARAELMKAREEERALRLEIIREVRDAHLSLEAALQRIEVAEKAIETAKENARIEHLRYEAGVGTGTDVIDAQTALLRAETDYYQALYDKTIAVAAIFRATGQEWPRGTGVMR